MPAAGYSLLKNPMAARVMLVDPRWSAGDSVALTWGSDDKTVVNGGGWAGLQPDGTLKAEIGCDHATFIARRQPSSTAC